MTDYQQQAAQFAAKHGIKLTVISEDFRPYFADDKQSRSVYKCRLSRNGKQYTFNFGQSIANTGQEPTMYDVLACLTKYDPQDFDNFCAEYGYDPMRTSAAYTYKAVCKEFAAVNRLFGDIIEELAEIN